MSPRMDRVLSFLEIESDPGSCPDPAGVQRWTACQNTGTITGWCRSVAQLGRALPSGGRGRRFESSHSDQKFPAFSDRCLQDLGFLAACDRARAGKPVPEIPCRKPRARNPVPETPCPKPRAGNPVPETPCPKPRADKPVPRNPVPRNPVPETPCRPQMTGEITLPPLAKWLGVNPVALIGLFPTPPQSSLQSLRFEL